MKALLLILSKDELYRDAASEEPIDREIVHESLVDIDLDFYYNTVKAQHGKPLYIPSRSELLNYMDERYFEETEHTKALKCFFMKKMKFSAEKSYEIVFDCYLWIRLEDDFIQDIFDSFERMKIKMTKAQLEEVLSLIIAMHNSTRIPYNRCFTPNELARKFGSHYSAPKIIEIEPNMNSVTANGNLDTNEYSLRIMNSDLSEDMELQMLSEISKIKKPMKLQIL